MFLKRAHLENQSHLVQGELVEYKQSRVQLQKGQSEEELEDLGLKLLIANEGNVALNAGVQNDLYFGGGSNFHIEVLGERNDPNQEKRLLILVEDERGDFLELKIHSSTQLSSKQRVGEEEELGQEVDFLLFGDVEGKVLEELFVEVLTQSAQELGVGDVDSHQDLDQILLSLVVSEQKHQPGFQDPDIQLPDLLHSVNQLQKLPDAFLIPAYREQVSAYFFHLSLRNGTILLFIDNSDYLVPF